MVYEDVIKEKYGKDYTFEKWYDLDIDLTTLPKNKAVVFGDGETFCWMLTKKESVPAETLVRQGVSQPVQTADLKEPEAPIGDFILNFKCNNEILSGSEGTFYHYADVCSMLKAYKQKEHKCAGCDTIIYHQSYCGNCRRLWES